MQTSMNSKGFVVICDIHGTIENVIQNEYEAVLQFPVGIQIESVFDTACREKVTLFIDEALAKKAVYDWELVICLDTGSMTLHCAAILTESKLMIIGVGSRGSDNHVMVEMLRLNNEQNNLMRTLMKEIQVGSRRAEHDNSVYNELTRLTNQTSTMQREQLKKNYELEQLNQKLQESEDRFKRLFKDSPDAQRNEGRS
jgi:sensor histidine kinase YesM